MEAVVAPQYLTPSCKKAFPKIEVKNEIKIVSPQAIGVSAKVSCPLNFPRAKRPTILNKLMYKVHLKGSICLKPLLSKYTKNKLYVTPDSAAKNIPIALPPVTSSTNITIPIIEKTSADIFFKVTFSLKNKIQIK